MTSIILAYVEETFDVYNVQNSYLVSVLIAMCRHKLWDWAVSVQ